MTPARLLLVRHGETDWNRDHRWQGHSDVPLNAAGRRQARALALRLAGTPVDALHTSDLVRAAETAAVLGRTLGLDPVLSPLWREIHLGTLEGARSADVAHAFVEPVSAAARLGRAAVDGGESHPQLLARLRRGYARLCREHAGRTVLVVSHGGALKALIADLIGLPAIHIDRLSLRGNGSLTILDFRAGRPQLVLLNDTAHLGGS